MSEPLFTNLVLSGGGTGGFAHLGALQVLEASGILSQFVRFAGTSVGAVISLMLVLNLPLSEIEAHAKKQLFIFTEHNGIFQNFRNLVATFGIFSGSSFVDFLKSLLNDNDPTFLELYTLTQKHLVVVATCLNQQTPVYFDHVQTPDMNVITAIRMSISIPLFLSSVSFEGQEYVDGGCTDNYPLQVFDHVGKTIGIYLDCPAPTFTPIKGILDYIIAFKCLISGMSVNCISSKINDPRTICIDTSKCPFSISQLLQMSELEQRMLMEEGKTQTQQQLPFVITSRFKKIRSKRKDANSLHSKRMSPLHGTQRKARTQQTSKNQSS